jgi:flagellar assembly protein FliH
MISQSEHVDQFDLGAHRGALAVHDLLMRDEARRRVEVLRYPDFLARTESVERVEEPVLEVVGRDVEGEMLLKVKAAREEGRAQAKSESQEELGEQLAEERERVDQLRLEFARDRQRFFAAAESQVVRLALAVARRVLAREVGSDGLHLRATVKAALARVQDSSVTTLRVPVEEEEEWAALFKTGAAGEVKVVGDERMSSGECVLETTVGRVELGVEVQLAEIERGFRELVQGDGWEMSEPEDEGLMSEQDRFGSR